MGYVTAAATSADACQLNVDLRTFSATTFLELWKRKQAILIWEWDLQNTEEDVETRPEFETAEKNFRTNPVTKEREAYIPTLSKIYRYCVTAGVVTFMVGTHLQFET